VYAFTEEADSSWRRQNAATIGTHMPSRPVDALRYQWRSVAVAKSPSPNAGECWQQTRNYESQRAPNEESYVR